MKIIGHRGAKGLAPENTLAAFAKGIEHHVDELEFDVRVTRDFVPILHHDPALTNGEDKLVIITATYAELKARDPDLTTLEEALDFIDTRCALLIEVKPGEPIEPIVDILKRYLNSGMYAAADISLGSFSQTTLLDLHRALPDAPKVVIERWSSVKACLRAKSLGTKRLNMRSWWLYRGFLKSMHKRGWQIAPYTVNDQRKARAWQPYVYGIITDYPDLYQK